MNEIQKYKEIIKNNKNNYITSFLSFMLESVSETNKIDINTLFKGYSSGLEVIKRKIEYQKNNIPEYSQDFSNIKIPNVSINVKVETLSYAGKENGFILDCLNKEKSSLKEYVPLYDKHLRNYLRNEKIQKQLKVFGFVNKNGYIMVDQLYKSRMKYDAQVDFSTRIEDKIRDIRIINRLNDKYKDPRKEAYNINIPTKIKLPKITSGYSTLYMRTSTSKNGGMKKSRTMDLKFRIKK